MEIRVRGWRQLAASLTRLGRQIDAQPMTGPAEPVAAAIRAEAPVRSGRLRSSVHVEPVGPGAARVVSGLVYAGVIARGWAGHNIEANPFDERGADRGEEAAAAVVDRQVQAWCNQVRGA